MVWRRRSSLRELIAGRSKSQLLKNSVPYPARPSAGKTCASGFNFFNCHSMISSSACETISIFVRIMKSAPETMGPKRSGEWLLAVQSKTHPAVQSSVAGEHRWQSPAVSMRRQSRPRLSHQSQSSGRFEMRKWSGQISWLSPVTVGILRFL